MSSLHRELAVDRKQTTILEEYWERSRARDGGGQQALNKDSPLTSPVVSFNLSRGSPRRGHARNRSASDAAALIPPGHRLSPFHPAWSLTTLLDTFGPLIFPIHRAALLRKRILISTHAPVHETCNFGRSSLTFHISSAVSSNIRKKCMISRSSPTYPFRYLTCLIRPHHHNG